jgi:hypothetical protein
VGGRTVLPTDPGVRALEDGREVPAATMAAVGAPHPSSRHPLMLDWSLS